MPLTISSRNQRYIHRKFPLNGLALYAPFWHPELHTSSLVSKDPNARTGTVTGVTWSTTGGAFSATTGVITFPATNSLSPTDGAGNDQPFTIIVWVNTADMTNCVLASRGATTTREWDLYIEATDKIEIDCHKFDASAAIWKISDAAITAYQNSFVCVGATYDGTEAHTGFTLYVNGASVAATGGSSGVYAGMTRSADVLQIGRLWGTTYGVPIKTIGEIILYVNKTLTVQEMYHYWQATKWRYA